MLGRGAAGWMLLIGHLMINDAMGFIVQPVPLFVVPDGPRSGPVAGSDRMGVGQPVSRFHQQLCNVKRREQNHPGRWPKMMAKEFDKKYDKSFNDFRTSGSMPSIPTIAEQFSQAASYVSQKGVNVKEGDPAFGKRITEAQEALQKEQEEGMRSYEQLKKELLVDTAYVGILGLAAFIALASEQTASSYCIGAFGSASYAFLLTRTADRMGEQGNKSTMFDPGTPLRFAILFFLVILAAKNRETIEILPMLFGFFVPYKLASLRPAFVDLPPVKETEVRVYRNWFDSKDARPFKIEYGSKVLGKAAKRRVSFKAPDGKDSQVTGSSAPLGKRKIASIEEQYEALKKGTMD